ncbi:hypothetical protein ANI02nite_18490 [Acetobacter nitrogenifigens DSM 23921 = NBRC 105050]|uniref:Uncharacterized protein n=1 Tax=Acetobacter nitrogenifigens DSM 23921 = NBRC 105050 TaxID=1120919 RepID=A0A511XAL6_9PROT|nr:hypothetical protein ANI02nite_18490 [Acetobacter nitrogenifigens DSM 23921 = NBRC 105050]
MRALFEHMAGDLSRSGKPHVIPASYKDQEATQCSDAPAQPFDAIIVPDHVPASLCIARKGLEPCPSTLSSKPR